MSDVEDKVVEVTLSPEAQGVLSQLSDALYRDLGVRLDPGQLLLSALSRWARAVETESVAGGRAAAPAPAPAPAPAALAPPLQFPLHPQYEPLPLPQPQPFAPQPQPFAAPSYLPAPAPAAPSPLLGGGAPEQQPPANWTQVGPGPTSAEQVMHQWYSERGWRRYLVQTATGQATLYWTPIAMYRPLCANPYDAGIVPTEIPQGYGSAHLVPANWALRGADAAEQVEVMQGRTPSLTQGAGGLPGKARVMVAGE